MHDLETRLKDENVPFELKDGMVWYSPKYAEQVKNITDDLDRPYVETLLATEDLREFFISELKANHRRYQVLVVNGKQVIRWWPNVPGEEDQMRNRVATYLEHSRASPGGHEGTNSATPPSSK
jgi:hypothetical protein